MSLLDLESRLEHFVASMNDEVIVRIVRKLCGAVWGSLQRHARMLALTSVAAVPVLFSCRYIRALAKEWHLEWQWERKCHMTLVSGQVWLPIRAREMEGMRPLKVHSRTPTAQPRRSDSLFSSTFSSELAEGTDVTPAIKKRLSFVLDAYKDDSEGEHSHQDALASAETLYGVAKRTLFQDDVWKIGILRDSRIQRKLIEAAMKTSVEDPFVTSFLDDCDTWYVMNALVNQLSGLCAMSHLGAVHAGKVYSDGDAFVVALMVPRSRCRVKRDFLGEALLETSTSLTKIRAVVVKERHVVEIARRQVYMDPNASPRFQERWHVLEMIGDKYRRFEACKILRAAIARQECERAAAASQEGEGDTWLEDRPTSQASHVWQRQESDSIFSPRMNRIFSRVTSTLTPEEAHLAEEYRCQRVREISALQFIETAIEMQLSPREAEMLFQVLDVNGDGMLSVDEVESERHKKGRQYAGKNYISMHLQRVFLPVPPYTQPP